MPASINSAISSYYSYARQTGVIPEHAGALTEDQAHRGIRRFSGTPHGNRLDAVLIVGDNYYIDWKRAG